jgi:hypothetical protein
VVPPAIAASYRNLLDRSADLQYCLAPLIVVTEEVKVPVRREEIRLEPDES